jgi:hypothetical protein
VRRVLEKGRRRVGDRAWDDAYRRGRALSRTDAIARLDPDALDAPDALDDPAAEAGDGVARTVGAGQARRR